MSLKHSRDFSRGQAADNSQDRIVISTHRSLRPSTHLEGSGPYGQ